MNLISPVRNTLHFRLVESMSSHIILSSQLTNALDHKLTTSLHDNLYIPIFIQLCSPLVDECNIINYNRQNERK